MSFQINLANVKIACIAGIVSLLAGCATVRQESDNPQAPTRGAQTSGADRTPGTKTGTVSGKLPVVEVSAPQQLPDAIDLTCEADELFQRMRNGFSMPDINNDLVLYHQQWYLNRPDYLRRMVERSSRYMHHIVEELDKRGMPMELALLPMVESAYNPMALSRSKASGLWQFIPATGKRYNLDQNWWKDDRRDIVASTAAALDYLQSIYEMHGDWHLALASYNWGEGAVGRAIAKNKAAGLPTDYLSLTMPNETRNYVPKLQALKNIFGNPALVAQLDLQKIPNRPYFGTVTKTADIDVKVAAKLAEMPVEDFVALNPSHNRPIIKSDTPMVIPADKVDTFISNLEAHEGSNKPLSSWQSYTMRPGDKLEKIAPRFGMTVANLKAANGISGQIRISPGLTLLVPGHGSGDVAGSGSPPDQPRLPQADPVPAASSAAGRSHTVRKGETLQAIARRYDTTVAELKRINHLRGDKVSPGTRLAVAAETRTVAKEEEKPRKATGAPVKTASREAEKPKKGVAGVTKQAATQKTTKITHYIVRHGDTLASIARQFKVDKDDLLRWNRIAPNAVTPGKTLTIQLALNP